jgi:hypothetical protein
MPKTPPTEEEAIMIKGLAITPPVVGGMSIGKVAEMNGNRLPQKDDWLTHPVDAQLREQGKKLRTLPIRCRLMRQR